MVSTNINIEGTVGTKFGVIESSGPDEYFQYPTNRCLAGHFRYWAVSPVMIVEVNHPKSNIFKFGII